MHMHRRCATINRGGVSKIEVELAVIVLPADPVPCGKQRPIGKAGLDHEWFFDFISTVYTGKWRASVVQLQPRVPDDGRKGTP